MLILTDAESNRIDEKQLRHLDNAFEALEIRIESLKIEFDKIKLKLKKTIKKCKSPMPLEQIFYFQNVLNSFKGINKSNKRLSLRYIGTLRVAPIFMDLGESSLISTTFN